MIKPVSLDKKFFIGFCMFNDIVGSCPFYKNLIKKYFIKKKFFEHDNL